MGTTEMFANYDPEGEFRRQTSFEVRPAHTEDRDPLAAISHQRSGGELATLRAGMERRIARPLPEGLLCVAELTDAATRGSLARHSALVGFGELAWLEWPRDEMGQADSETTIEGEPTDERARWPLVPDGWYLTGVIVSPEWRRAGIGHALTLARIEAWRDLVEDAARSPLRFVVNATNRVSIDLHERLGFMVESRGFRFPGVTFSGGKGLLFRLDR